MARQFPKLDIILLAAGQSRRMGSGNKLLMPYQKTTLIRSVASTLIAAAIGDITVVTGFEAAKIRTALAGLNLGFCHNPSFETGQMSSVVAGSRALPQQAGMMIALSDMPLLSPQDYQFLRDSFFEQDQARISIPYYGKERGNPIIIPAPMIPEITQGALHAGCRKLVSGNPDKIAKVPVSSTAYVWDIDNPSDYEHTLTRLSMSRAPCC